MQPSFFSLMKFYLVPLRKDNYPLLVSNVGWLGLLSVLCLGGQAHFGMWRSDKTNLCGC